MVCEGERQREGERLEDRIKEADGRKEDEKGEVRGEE